MISVTVFLRPQCAECDQTVSDLQSLQDQIPHRLYVVDVEQDPVLKVAYENQTVPVVQIGPYKLTPPFTRQDLQVALGAARDRTERLEQQGGDAYRERVQRGQNVTGSDKFSYWLSEHYMLLFNGLLLLYIGLPFLAPVLMKAGATAPARVIYTIYSPLCHQLTFRSFFLFGEQPYYPRALAHVPGEVTFEQATGFDSNDFADARSFVGNEQIGYKVALCERDVAIYLSILLFGIIFSVTGKRIKSIPWYLWILIGIIPIAIDGGSQLTSALSSVPSWLPVRESTPPLRVLTGVLFGVTTAWYLFPFIEEGMRETRGILARKFAVTGQKAVPPEK
jgi:uncharacterized membrane protein